MILSYLTSNVVNHVAFDDDEIVGIGRVSYGEGDMRILLHISMLDTAKRGIDQHKVAVGVNPSRRDLRSPIRINRGQVNEVLAFQHFPCAISQLGHVRSSLERS